ncbi:MAG: TrmH family RNA methyltransferase [Patescibacteria group bacterium]
MAAKRLPILDVIAHDIRSRENVGALLRTCEFLGAHKVWFTGYTPALPDARIEKVSLGAEKDVLWEKQPDVMSVLSSLKKKRFRLVGLELADEALELASYKPPERIALLLGNEVTGITPTLLACCDDRIEIARHGKKESLNVSIAAGIAIHWMLCQKSQ